MTRTAAGGWMFASALFLAGAGLMIMAGGCGNETGGGTSEDSPARNAQQNEADAAPSEPNRSQSEASPTTQQDQENSEAAFGANAIDWPDRDVLVSNPSNLSGDLATIFGLIQKGRTGAARIRLVKFDKVSPGNGRSAFLYGLSYHQEKKYGKARPHFVRAIELEPSY